MSFSSVSRLAEHPVWNTEALRLITTGRAHTSKCTNPLSARIYFANKVLAEFAKADSARGKPSSMSGLKWRLKQALRVRQIFGVSSMGWDVAKSTAQCEQFLMNEAGKADHQHNIMLDTKQFESIVGQASHWSDIQILSTQIRSHQGTLILQGSQADGATTAFSDIDLILFGDRANVELQKLKSKLDHIVLTADPLQHHGVFFYDEAILKRYSESVLPLATLDYATAIAEPVELSFQVLNDEYSPAVTLWSFVQGLKPFLAGKISIRGMWDWKFKISQFLLLPALLAAVLGKYIYKGDSFRFAEPMFSDQAWKTVEQLTRVRRLWPLCAENSEEACFYLKSKERIFGCLSEDPLEVPRSIAIWKHESFLTNANCFLDETLQLAGLH